MSSLSCMRLVALCAVSVQRGSGEWDGENMHMTHYWDCNGQGCDAPTLEPWDESKYVSPPGYAPQNPLDFGGPLYGETMWLTGASSDALSALLGPDDGCCGTEEGTGVGGCGKCLLVQNPDAVQASWTAVVMKKNRCPPWATGCAADEPHFDIAAPGFDNLLWSTANVCGVRAGTGFTSQTQSEALGSWWTECSDTAQCMHKCESLPAEFVEGCKLFASWGWSRGDPERVKYRAVTCPSNFTAHIAAQFGPQGVDSSPTPPTAPTPTVPMPAPTPVPPTPPTSSTPCASCSTCAAVPGNPKFATDTQCAPCAMGAQNWWPCLTDGLCQCDASEPTPAPTPPCASCSTCAAVPGNPKFATDTQCAPCAMGAQNWWPCLTDGLCQCGVRRLLRLASSR